MIHDMRPAVMDAIRSSMNRRGALAALFAAIPLVPLGGEHASAARNQRHGKRGAKSEGRKKKAKPGPPGPQGPPGGQGPAGARGTEGPKAITAPLTERFAMCALGPGEDEICTAPCNDGELAVSGGFAISHTTVIVMESRKTQETWAVRAINSDEDIVKAAVSFTVYVYCLPA